MIRRDFRSGVVTLSEETEAGWVPVFDGSAENPSGREELHRHLESLLGVGEGAGWLRTGMVLRGDLGTLLDGAVWAWMAGDRSDEMDAVLEALRESRDRLAHTGEASEEDSGRDLLRLRREAVAWEQQAGQLQRLRVRLAEVEAQGVQAKAEVARHDEMLENLVRFEDLSRDRTRLERKLEKLREEQTRIRRQVEAVEAGKRKLEEEFADFLDAPGDVEECLQEWTESVARRRDLERDQERAQEAVRTLPVTRTRRNGALAAGAAGVVGWLACVGAGAMTAGFLLFPLFAAAGYGAVWYLDRNTERVRLSREQELVWLDSEREKVLQREREARTGLGALTRFAEPAALRREHKRYLEARAALERSRLAMESDRPLSEVVDAYESTFSNLQLLDTQTRDLVAQAPYLSGLDSDLSALAARREEARAERDRASARAETLEREAESLRVQAEEREADLAEPGRLAEDIAQLEERLREREETARALETASRVLQEVVESYREGHVGRVAERAGAIFARVSRGRYRELRLTGAMEPEVRETDGEWRRARELSEGARSQLFLALRLAAAQEIAGERGFPIVLDDAFRGWDDDRLAEAGRVLAEIAESGRQVIVLGSDPRLNSWGHAMLSLEVASPGSPDSSRHAA